MKNGRIAMRNGEGKQWQKIPVFAFFFFTFSFFLCTCDNLLQQNDSAAVEEGYGRVSINFTGGQGRTVLPAKVFDNYVYTFTNDGESLELSPDTDNLFTLSVGEWQVEVKAYVGEIDPDNLAATGTANFTVNSDTTEEVTVELDAVVTSGYGTFTYTIRYPEIAEAEITLKKLPGLIDSVELTPANEETDDGITVITKTTENVPAGFYLLTVLIRNGGWHAGISEAVHIYPLLTTEYEAEFDEDDLLPTDVNIADIKGITPVIGEAPVTVITETEQYTGTVTWSPHPTTFAATTTYVANITLTIKDGYLMNGVPANFFTVSGANNVHNMAGLGQITAYFGTPHSHLKVTNSTEWNNAMNTIREGGINRKYFIEVTGNVGVGGITSANNNTAGLGTITGIEVWLIGNGKLYLAGQGSIIRIGANQSILIDSGDLILEGLRNGQNYATQNNNTSIVYVSGGTNAILAFKNGTISGNTASVSGGVYVCGGVLVDNGTFNMFGGTISDNTAGVSNSSGSSNNGSGGGVFINNGNFTMSGGTIINNTATSINSYGGSNLNNNSTSGGGVYINITGGSSSNFTMTGGTISGNTASSNNGNSRNSNGNISGGGVYISGGSFTMSGGTISNNTANSNNTGGNGISNTYMQVRSGGGVYVNNGSFTMNSGTINDNTANSSHSNNSGNPNSNVSSSGGVFVIGSSSSFTMNSGTINNNSAISNYIMSNTSFTEKAGGGVYISGGIFTMINGTISGNASVLSGGVYVGDQDNSGVFVSGNGGTFEMRGGEISGNTANGGSSFAGGVYVGYSGTFIMTEGIISGNTTTYGGSGVYVNGISTITGGKISDNTTLDANNGGGVLVSSSTTIGGTVQIYGNTRNGVPNNLNLNLGSITLGSGVNAPANGMNVYVTTTTTEGTHIFVQSGATEEVIQYFHTDQSDKAIILLDIRLAIIDIVGSITAPAWREGNTVSLTAPSIDFPTGQTVTAQGWQISNNASGGWSNFTPPSTADMSYNGKYLRYYAASSNGQTYYSNAVIIKVISATLREVTIAMWDSYGDGWNSSAALRISVNGINLATNAILASGSGPGYYPFEINSGDVVRIYWVNGGTYDRECAFALYYSDDPPSPAFNPSSGTTDTARVLVSKRYNNPSGAVGYGTLMGSFTVP